MTSLRFWIAASVAFVVALFLIFAGTAVVGAGLSHSTVPLTSEVAR